jgi:hypothetical protein
MTRPRRGGLFGGAGRRPDGEGEGEMAGAERDVILPSEPITGSG